MRHLAMPMLPWKNGYFPVIWPAWHALKVAHYCHAPVREMYMYLKPGSIHSIVALLAIA
jgi:hypothetical protein